MIGASDEFSVLMARVRSGCPEAVRELTEHYGPHILRVVRRRMTRNLRSEFDSLDFLQDVWASFFARPDQLARLDDADALIGFLVTVARNKVLDVVRRRLGAGGYRTANERSLERTVPSEGAALPGKEPTPSQFAVANEAWDRLLSLLPAHYQPVAELLRDGFSPAEVAGRVGVSERTVWRVIRRLAEGSAS
jgi:RNA polymerase sigma-70 factor (ECF subfamily)